MKNYLKNLAQLVMFHSTSTDTTIFEDLQHEVGGRLGKAWSLPRLGKAWARGLVILAAQLGFHSKAWSRFSSVSTVSLS